MIGAHASISPSILEGIKYIQSIGGTAIQIFTGSNQSSSLKAKQTITEEQASTIKKYLKEHKLYLAIHAIYLLNFCSYPPSSQRIHYAHKNLIYDLELGEKIGASTVVLHLGYQTKLTSEEAYNNMADNIIYILKQTQTTAPNVSISLETPAGQGSQIATTIPEFEKLFNLIQQKLSLEKKSLAKKLDNRLTICVDTAHIFSSGHDIRTPKLFKTYFTEIFSKFGKRIALIHLNDSKQPLNSRKDQHEGLGDGTIFSSVENKESLKYLVKWSKKHIVPIVLETHKAGSPKNPDGSLYAQEIALLKSFLQNKSSFDLKTWKLNHKYASPSKNLETSEKLNKELLKRFYQLKEYYGKVEKDTIRSRAYSKAYLILQNYPEEITSGKQVEHLIGIGKQSVKKIDEYLNNGEMEIIISNPGIMTFNDEKEQQYKLNILGFGEKKMKELNKQKLSTILQVRKAFTEGKLKLNDKELLGVEHFEDLNKKMTRAQSKALFTYISNKIKKSLILKKLKATIEIAGSYPSGKKESKDLDILIFTSKYSLPVSSIPIKYINEIIELFNNDKDKLKVYQKGNTKLLAIINYNNIFRHVDIRLLPKESEVTGRHYFTSGKDFNVMMRQLASSKGYLLNEYGLYNRNNLSKSIKLETEEELFSKLEIPFIPLQKRRNLYKK